MPGPFPDSMTWATQQQRDAYLDAQSAAAAKQYDAQQAAEKEQQQQKTTPLAPHQELIQRVSNVPAKVTPSYLDDMIHYVDGFAHDGSWGEAATRVGRDAAAGVADAAANTGDAVAGAVQDVAKDITHPQEAALEAEDPALADRMRQTPSIWQHAKNAILDFRDAVALKDPNNVDKLTQSVAQLAIPFMGYSKLLEGLQLATLGTNAAGEISAVQPFGSYLAKTALNDAGRFAQGVAIPGAITDATALQPHAPRMADIISLGRNTEGHFGDVLQAIAPDGSALNGYINYLTDRTDESEAEGRFKNVLDGAMVNSIATPLLGLVGSVLKQGTRGLGMLVDNGVTSMGDFPRPLSLQRGGPLTNNASGESAASQEAINRFAHERAAGVTRWRIDPDGNRQPLPGVDALDVGAPKGHLHTLRDADGHEIITDRGGLSASHASGLLARAQALKGE